MQERWGSHPVPLPPSSGWPPLPARSRPAGMYAHCGQQPVSMDCAHLPVARDAIYAAVPRACLPKRVFALTAPAPPLDAREAAQRDCSPRKRVRFCESSEQAIAWNSGTSLTLLAVTWSIDQLWRAAYTAGVRALVLGQRARLFLDPSAVWVPAVGRRGS